MPPRNYSLKNKKYQKYIQVLQEDEFNILSTYCEYLQFLFKYKSLLQFKIAQIQRIEETKEEVKENEKLYNQIEDEKFVLKVELDKLSRGRYKLYTKQLAEIDETKLTYEQKLDLVSQMIQHVLKVISQNKYKPIEKFNIDEIWSKIFPSRKSEPTPTPVKATKKSTKDTEEVTESEVEEKSESEVEEPKPTPVKATKKSTRVESRKIAKRNYRK